MHKNPESLIYVHCIQTLIIKHNIIDLESQIQPKTLSKF